MRFNMLGLYAIVYLYFYIFLHFHSLLLGAIITGVSLSGILLPVKLDLIASLLLSAINIAVDPSAVRMQLLYLAMSVI